MCSHYNISLMELDGQIDVECSELLTNCSTYLFPSKVFNLLVTNADIFPRKPDENETMGSSAASVMFVTDIILWKNLVQFN